MPGLFDRLQDEITRRDVAAGLSPADLLALPADLGRPLQALLRQGPATVPELAGRLGTTPEAAQGYVDALAERGLVRVEGEGPAARYAVALARRRARRVPFHIWEALAERTAQAPGEGEGGEEG
jgi:predicted ArsR family transcriptional regulator